MKFVWIFFSERSILMLQTWQKYKDWATPFEFHTPPMEDLRNIYFRGECDFQVNKLIWHF